jgi:hypothetical protein
LRIRRFAPYRLLIPSAEKQPEPTRVPAQQWWEKLYIKGSASHPTGHWVRRRPVALLIIAFAVQLSPHGQQYAGIYPCRGAYSHLQLQSDDFLTTHGPNPDDLF